MKWAIVTHILGLAVGAGLNLYAATLVTGLAIRYGWVNNLPPEMQVLANPIVLAVAGFMYLAEFAADKVPFVTPIWDAAHTIIRPIGGALLALSAVGNVPPSVKIIAMLVAGTLALGTHSSKMGFRMVAHAVPEPMTHSLISVAEDASVVALLALAYSYPMIALPILLVIIAGIAMAVPLLIRIARFLRAGVHGRVESWFSTAKPQVDPDWTTDVSRNNMMVFSRKARGVAFLTKGAFDPEAGRFYYRNWGNKRSLEVGPPLPSIEWGLIYNVVRTENGSAFFVTKEWCGCLRVNRARTATVSPNIPA